MRRWWLMLAVPLALWLAVPAQAQQSVLPYCVTGTSSSGVVLTAPCSSSNALPVTTGTTAPAARHFPGCTVGTTSAQCLAASTALTFVQIQNTSASASVACAWGTAAVLNSTNSVQLAAGQSASWGTGTVGIPNEALNCISSAASTPLYVEWN